MKSKIVAMTFFCLAVLTLFAGRAAQHPDDKEGCKDSKLLTRLPGCWIEGCEKKDFDAAKLQIRQDKEEGDGQKEFEGEVETIYYACPEGLSSLQIHRNAENAMRDGGFTIAFSGKTIFGAPIVTARKGPQWLQVFMRTYSGGEGGYTVTSVKVKEMEQFMEARADAMEAEINKSGRVAVYGINFDTGKSTIKPESEKVLSEILLLLKKNADWNLRVEGHTDNVGAKAANQALSEQRAAAVVAWLAKNGVGKARLTSKGFGDSTPVADNATEEGRARNRRVELAKQ